MAERTTRKMLDNAARDLATASGLSVELTKMSGRTRYSYEVKVWGCRPQYFGASDAYDAMRLAEAIADATAIDRVRAQSE
jgi:hypothetical protein